MGALTRRVGTTSLTALAVFGAAWACPAPAVAGHRSAPDQMWGIEATNAFAAGLTVKRAQSLRASGLNTIVVERRRVSGANLPRLARIAGTTRLTLVSAGPPPAGGSRVSGCLPTFALCGVVTRSSRTGLDLARVRIAPVVIIRLGGPADLQALAGRTAGSRVIALLPVRQLTTAEAALWRSAIASARSHRGLDLAVAPESDAALATYLTLLKPVPPTSGGNQDGNGPDLLPPAAPLTVAVGAAASSSISLTWPAANDNVGVVGYELYRGGVPAGSVTGTTHTFAGLACATTYNLAVAALDAAGNRSPRTAVVAATSACAGGGGGGSVVPPLDSTPPSIPTALAAAPATASAPLSWSPSTDAVGYTVYRDYVPIGDTAASAFAGDVPLCDRVYTFTVDAYDAAGNRSAQTAPIAITRACPATVLDSGPVGTVATSSASFFFSSPESGVSFECSLDGAAFASCTTPHVLTSLADGPHAFAVRARRAAGHADPSPASRSWMVDTVAPASVFVSAASGSDAGACTAAAPCSTFDRAYHAAAPGDVVEIAAGNYGDQAVDPDASKTAATSAVVFRPAAGAEVVTGDLNVSAAHVEFRDLRLQDGSLNVHSPANDVTLRDSVATNGGLFILGGSNISIIGGSFGPGEDFHSQIAPWPPNTEISNVLIDGVTFHDWTRSNDGVHTECLQVAAGNGITIRNSRFRNCHVFDLTFTMFNTTEPPTNITIENNFFDKSGAGGFYAVWFQSDAPSWTNVLVRNNSTLQDIAIDPASPSLTNVRFVNNVGELIQRTCNPRITYRYNVWNGAACDPTDRNSPSGFVDPPTLNLHLLRGSAAIDAGDPTNHAATDIDGDSRPRGGGPDAGADEAS